ncbi:hypothetical protein QAD02_003261 [Eretmocerus hayati]|uniref:Uncharacterized protein n=1 Tax=Eretmocerus hayati TaxID=131215 RepID=A0ACC2NLK3_9HYME|nr:hypothetical protein QAD02_003261 [Eretmocerus hayati]
MQCQAAERSRIRGCNFRLKRKFLQDLDQVAQKLVNAEKKPCLNFDNKSSSTSHIPTVITNPVQKCVINLDKTQNHVNSSSNEHFQNAKSFPKKPCLTLNTKNDSTITCHPPNTSNTTEKSCEENLNAGKPKHENPQSSKSLDAADTVPNDLARTELLCNSPQESKSKQSNASAAGVTKQADNEKDSINQGNQSKLATDLKKTFKRLAIPYSHIDVIVKTLKPYHSNLPQSHKTLLGTGKKCNIEKFGKDRLGSESEFVYFGLAENLKRIVNPKLHKDRKLKLQISFDGLPLFKSSPREFWPILCKIYVEGNPYNPFVVAVHNGYGKPKDIHQYLWKFVRELNTLLARGIEIENEHWDVGIMAFVCDTPARAYIKCTQGHAGFHACEQCTIIGFKVDNTTIFPITNVELRTDASFRLQTDEGHHHDTVSPLVLIKPSVDMIRMFMLDFMHLVCLGITKRLVSEYWLKTSLNFMNKVNMSKLSLRLLNLNKQIPVDFQRSTRQIELVHLWKATEYRFFVLYSGMFIMKDLLPPDAYKHFLLLSIGCRILCSQDYFLKYHAVAKECLEKFVKLAQHPNLYGLKILVINMHNLLHLADQVKYMGVPLMDVSAFAFENLLGKIKKFIESGNKPLNQLCNKMDNYLECEKPSEQPDFEIISENKADKSGKIILKRIKLHGTELNMNDANNVVLLDNGEIVRITSIFTHSKPKEKQEICVRAKKVDILGPALDYPIDSSLLNMFKVNEDKNSSVIDTTLDHIKCKMILMDIFEESSSQKESYAMPLLHMN